jgi:hypothetical protein
MSILKQAQLGLACSRRSVDLPRSFFDFHVFYDATIISNLEAWGNWLLPFPCKIHDLNT